MPEHLLAKLLLIGLHHFLYLAKTLAEYVLVWHELGRLLCLGL